VEDKFPAIMRPTVEVENVSKDKLHSSHIESGVGFKFIIA
jgi:hypothetical protein